ncbi:MAG: hypothetical protein K8E66_03135 [Phycisphaerales bacterium]|nr:hypothetical protein [Phycisphaerales bacterium]
MPVLRDPRLMYLKAGLFVLIGVVSCTLILIEHPSLKLALLLALAIWAFCRAYYFAFYVIEHYIDSEYRYAGLWSFVRYLGRNTRPKWQCDSDTLPGPCQCPTTTAPADPSRPVVWP